MDLTTEADRAVSGMRRAHPWSKVLSRVRQAVARKPGLRKVRDQG